MYARQTVYAKTWRVFFSEKKNEEDMPDMNRADESGVIIG